MDNNISPLSTEFLYELYATALRQDQLCAIVSQHMRSETTTTTTETTTQSTETFSVFRR